MRRAATVLLVVAVAGCSEQSSTPSDTYDATRQRRVLQPPPGEIRAVPPHAVRTDGIGPFLLGAPISDVLHLVGPRKVLLQIAGVVDYSLVRAESDTLLVGGARGRRDEEVWFVSAIFGDTAKIEGDITIGATVEELHAAMGAPLEGGDRAIDPRVIAFAKLPSGRFVVDGGKLSAIAVLHVAGSGVEITTDAGVDDAEEDGGTSGAAKIEVCTAAAVLSPHRAALIEASRLDASSVALGCFAGSGPEALVYTDDQLVVVGGEPDKLRRIASYSAPRGLVFAAPLDVERDGRDEIVLVSQEVESDEHVTRLELLRVEAGRFVRAASSDVYRISESAAAANGAKLSDIDILVEVQARKGRLNVSGLYVHRVSERPRTVAPLLEARIAVRRARPTDKPDDGELDAGIPDDGGSRGDQNTGERSRPKDAAKGGAP